MKNDQSNQTTMILGIVSVSCLVCSFFLGALGIIAGLVTGILAIVFNKKVMMPDNKSKAGFICGIIGLVGSALAIVATIIMLVFFGSVFGSFFNKAIDLTSNIVEIEEDAISDIQDQLEQYNDVVNQSENVINQSKEVINQSENIINQSEEIINNADNAINQANNIINSLR